MMLAKGRENHWETRDAKRREEKGERNWNGGRKRARGGAKGRKSINEK